MQLFRFFLSSILFILAQNTHSFSYVRVHPTGVIETRAINQTTLDSLTATTQILSENPQKPPYRKIITHDGYEIGYHFFDRNSPNLIIVGPGIMNKANHFMWVTKLFPTYDVILMDFRWKDMGNFLLSSDTLKNPKQALLYNVAHDVEAVIKHGSLPRHTTISGYGYCYGGWIFALFQASRPAGRLFDFLMFDSMPESLGNLLNNILKDPNLAGSREASENSFLKHITGFAPTRKIITKIVTQALADFSIAPALKALSIPTLFIHGQKDRVVVINQLYRNFGYCGSQQKIAFLTNCEHVENHQHHPLIFSAICKKFIEGTLFDSLS